MYSRTLTTLILCAVVPTLAFAQTSSQTTSAKGEWQASKLIHLDVYNPQNQKIGDIKELLLDKGGKIDNVVIGVGGFLGVGQHDVAVNFAELKWSNTPPTTTGSGASISSSNATYPDHAVLAATKDQLKAMPNFDYSK